MVVFLKVLQLKENGYNHAKILVFFFSHGSKGYIVGKISQEGCPCSGLNMDALPELRCTLLRLEGYNWMGFHEVFKKTFLNIWHYYQLNIWSFDVG